MSVRAAFVLRSNLHKVMDLPDLKRDDIARKSIRLRVSKRLAPVPPTRIESIPSPTSSSSTSSSSTIDSSFPITRIERQINEINLRNTLASSPAASPFSRISKFDASPNTSQQLANTNHVVLDAVPKSESFLKLSDIKKCSAISLDRTNKARMDFFTNPIQRTATPSLTVRPSQTTTTSQTQPSSIDMLNQLEKHIHQMEIDSKANEVFANSPATEPMPSAVKQMIKMTNRYGDHENLLNTGISNLASGTGLCYDEADGDDDDDLEPRPFQRGTGQARNSTLGVSLSATPKVGKPIGRTVSDTKNVESVVRSIRLGLKKMDDDLKNTAANRQSAAAAAKAKAQQQQQQLTNQNSNSYHQPTSTTNGTISPLTNKKKEDTIMVADRERLPLSHGHRPRVVATTTSTTSATAAQVASTSTPTKRFVDRETLRHAITSPTANRLKDAASARNSQVTP